MLRKNIKRTAIIYRFSKIAHLYKSRVELLIFPAMVSFDKGQFEYWTLKLITFSYSKFLTISIERIKSFVYKKTL